MIKVFVCKLSMKNTTYEISVLTAVDKEPDYMIYLTSFTTFEP